MKTVGIKTLGIVTVMAMLLVGTALAAPMFKVAQSRQNADVRVIHASPDAPNVDVLVNGNAAFTDVAFKEVTEYANVPAATYDIEVVPAGESAPVVIDAELPLKRFRDYTVIAVNTLDKIEPLVLQDYNYFAPSHKARVRFVHASPDAPAVDIAVKNGPVLFRNVEFKENTWYRYVDAGTYDLEVRLAGTNTVVLPLDGIALNGGTIYTAIAVGEVGEGTLGAVLSADATPNQYAFG